MQAPSYISLVVTGTADQYVQERIREAERHALIRAAKRRRPSVVAAVRLVIGQSMVGVGRWVAGRPRPRQECALDAPCAVKIAR